MPTAAQLAALRAQAGEIAKLTPAQMAGQRVIYSYNGLTAPPGLLSLIRQGDVGGVIFFSFNIASEAQIRGVIAKMIAANASPQNPARTVPAAADDRPGGRRGAPPALGAPLQSEAQIGAAASPAAQAAVAGAGAAANLRSVGMNLNLAPVLDVYRQPGDFDDQFQRSYSMNPSIVAEAGAAFVRAQQAGHVAATVKHFPGLGAASTHADTDLQPVTISLSAQHAAHRRRAAVPGRLQGWREAHHGVLGELPSAGPAAPGRAVAGRSCRASFEHRLGFTGVTITDALGAAALRSYGSLQNKTMLAARAGMDALLCTAIKPLPGWKCLGGLEHGFQTGALPRQAFEAQLAQLLQLRASLPA